MAKPKGRGKNQLFRLYILDDLLKRRDMFYSRDDLLRLCNERLQEYGFIAEGDEVTRRTVETDLEFLGYAKPGHTPKDLSFYEVFHPEFEEIMVDDEGTGKRKRAIRYKNPEFSVFEQKLTTAERDLLLSVMGTMGSFKGIRGFDLFERLEEKLAVGDLAPKASDSRTIVDFGFQTIKAGQVNPMAFFSLIEEKRPCRIVLSPYAPVQRKRIVVSPYQIRQYNGNWFLVACDHTTKAIRSLAVNWIDSFYVVEEESYIYLDDWKNPEDYFKDIIGVTVEKVSPVSLIRFAMKGDRARYVLANPFHPSLGVVSEDVDARLRNEFPGIPPDWMILKLACRVNQELYTKLLSFGNHLLVLEPKRVAHEMRSKVNKMLYLYSE